jgi:transposase
MHGYLGIDVSKGYADFTLLDDDKNQLEKVFQLDDTRQGHDKLKRLLARMLQQHCLGRIYCGLESTGGYENNWHHSIRQWSEDMPVKVVRLNPYVVKSNTTATLQRNVTDALSCRYIAEYLITQSKSIRYDELPSSVDYSAFRSLNNHINLQKGQCSQLINELKSVLYSVFPELLRYCKDSVPGWVLEVLIKYPSSTEIAKAKVEKLCRINFVDQAKASSIITKAKSSVAARSNVADAFLVRQLAKDILQKQEAIKEQKTFLSSQCNGEEIDLLVSMCGIGKYTACVAIIEIENIRRFASPKKLVSYFGLHPELKDSGDKKAVYKMSKRGRASMRGALFMCAQTAVMHDPHIKKIYHKHRSKGFNHKQAIGVVMQKLLRIIWGVLTHKVPYNAQVDESNQNKKVVRSNDSERAELKTKRRYQELDSEAPISARQNKKRKAHLESQVSIAEHVRDHQNTPV